MHVSFINIVRGNQYSRKILADMWGYSSFHAIARGVVTPQDDNKIILFVTEEKQESQEQYNDRLEENVLYWEGPKDHFGEHRMINASKSGDQIHLFYRIKHHTDFTYMGQIDVTEYIILVGSPSQFKLRIVT